MRRLLQFLFKKPVVWIANKLSSAPRQEDVFLSLDNLYADLHKGKKTKGFIQGLDIEKGKLIIFSDQHKGTRDNADDFRKAEPNYLAALHYYAENRFYFVSLGDCEELWKYTPDQVMKTNDDCFAAEKLFLDHNHYCRIFGNHDLVWRFSLQQNVFLKPVFGKRLKVYEAIAFKMQYNSHAYTIFMTHGHQGDKRNDGNAFSKWVVANIWTPIQRYLQVSINTPATSFVLSDRHNIIMSNWSATKPRTIFISGHTHKPVFASLDHIDRINRKLEKARAAGDSVAIASAEAELAKRKVEYAGKQQLSKPSKPSYFNSGCCCFDDGDITGIEIDEGEIRLIKWQSKTGSPVREVLESAKLADVFDELG